MKAAARPWRTVVVLVSVCILLLVMSLLILDSIGTADLNDAVNEARALGGPLTLEEVFSKLPDLPQDRNGAEVLLTIRPQLDSIKGEGVPVYDPKVQIQPGHRWSAAEDRQVGDFLATYQAELAAIDTLRNYPGGRFPVAISEDPSMTLLPNVAPSRTAMRLKQLQVVHRAMQGDNRRLVEDLDTLLRTPRLLDSDPFLISKLVARACQIKALRALEWAISLAPVEPEQLERIQGLLDPADILEQMSDSIRGERAAFIAYADYFRKTGSLAGSGGPDFTRVVRVPGAQGWIMRGEAEGIRLFSKVLGAASPMDMLAESKAAEQQAMRTSNNAVLIGQLLPSLSRALTLQLQTWSEMNCARVALAAERYRLDTDAWPTKLEDLVPRYIAEIPKDVFAGGKPLSFVNTEQRFIIYSLGADERDDRGAFCATATRTTRRMSASFSCTQGPAISSQRSITRFPPQHQLRNDIPSSYKNCSVFQLARCLSCE